MNLQVLIVDDEPLAQDVMETFLQKIPGTTVVGKCSNALEAFGALNKHQVDLMLLDINMPEINGMDFLKTLKSPPAVIFTTAYTEYAVASYELDAVDYLVKPIAFDRFLKAIHKAQDAIQMNAKSTDLVATSEAGVGIMFVRSEGKLVKIDLNTLWLVEGLKDYVCLWTDTGKVIVHNTMKNLEELLAAMPAFLRINKSYIINIKYVSEVDGNAVRIKTQVVTIGNTYRDAVHAVFNSYKLM